MRKKIIVFGASGTLGLPFIKYCVENIDEKKYEVIAVGRKKIKDFSNYGIKYIRIDINKDDMYSKLPHDNVYAIVNFVGIVPAYSHFTNEINIATTNFLGSTKILDYSRKVKADRVLYMHTWAEFAGYWGNKNTLSPKLDRKLMYTGDHAFYSITKAGIVESMEYYWQEYGIKKFVFILPNIYLYSPEKTYFVDGVEKKIAYRYMIDRAIQGKDIELWGDPKAYKDIVYIKDFCQMVYKGLFANVSGGTYCVGTGVKTTLEKQIKGIIKVFSPKDKQSKIIYKPNKKSFVSFVMDISNAKKDLGYKPEYDYLSYLKDYKKEMNKR